VVIADGCSTDRTREVVAQFQMENPELAIHLVENPERSIPSGLLIFYFKARSFLRHCSPITREFRSQRQIVY